MKELNKKQSLTETRVERKKRRKRGEMEEEKRGSLGGKLPSSQGEEGLFLSFSR